MAYSKMLTFFLYTFGDSFWQRRKSEEGYFLYVFENVDFRIQLLLETLCGY